MGTSYCAEKRHEAKKGVAHHQCGDAGNVAAQEMMKPNGDPWRGCPTLVHDEFVRGFKWFNGFCIFNPGSGRGVAIKPRFEGRDGAPAALLPYGLPHFCTDVCIHARVCVCDCVCDFISCMFVGTYACVSAGVYLRFLCMRVHLVFLGAHGHTRNHLCVITCDALFAGHAFEFVCVAHCTWSFVVHARWRLHHDIKPYQA